MDELVMEVLGRLIQITFAGGLGWGAWLVLRHGNTDDVRPKGGKAPGKALLPLLIVILAAPAIGRAAGVLEEARDAYNHADYRRALERFDAAARQGDTRAQEVLGFMYLHGHAVYGGAVPQDRGRAIYWFSRAAAGNREVSQHMLCVLAGKPEDTVIRRASCVSKIDAKPR